MITICKIVQPLNEVNGRNIEVALPIQSLTIIPQMIDFVLVGHAYMTFLS